MAIKEHTQPWRAVCHFWMYPTLTSNGRIPVHQKAESSVCGVLSVSASLWEGFLSRKTLSQCYGIDGLFEVVWWNGGRERNKRHRRVKKGRKDRKNEWFSYYGRVLYWIGLKLRTIAINVTGYQDLVIATILRFSRSVITPTSWLVKNVPTSFAPGSFSEVSNITYFYIDCVYSKSH